MNALNLLFIRGIMSYYEHVFIARPEVAPQQVENIVEDIKKIVSKNGGDTVYTEYWGLKKLAYKINKSEKGHYSLLRIDGESSTINEIERTICNVKII
jgi:small subunit ribosomal protein S6